MKLSLEERLARAICWTSFNHRPEAYTEATYWKSIGESARQNYRADAQQLLFVLSRLSKPLRDEVMKFTEK